jgi:hypothetical protein
MNLFERQPRDRYWIQTEMVSRKRWLLICSKSEYRERDRNMNHLGRGEGCPNNRVILAELFWGFCFKHWYVVAVDDIDFFEELNHAPFRDEFCYVSEAFPPIAEEAKVYLDQQAKKIR